MGLFQCSGLHNSSVGVERNCWAAVTIELRVSRESIPRLNEEQSEPLGELPTGYGCLRTPHYVGPCSPHRKTSACQARQWILHVVLSAGSVLPLICTQWKFSTLARGKSWLLIVSYSIGGGVLFHCPHSLNAGSMGDHFWNASGYLLHTCASEIKVCQVSPPYQRDRMMGCKHERPASLSLGEKKIHCIFIAVKRDSFWISPPSHRSWDQHHQAMGALFIKVAASGDLYKLGTIKRYFQMLASLMSLFLIPHIPLHSLFSLW